MMNTTASSMASGGMLPVASLNHISSVCRSVEESLDFYMNVLGFVPIRRPGSFNFNGAWLFNYGIGIHLLQSEDPKSLKEKTEINPKGNHISFQIACLQETKLQNVDPFTACYLGGGRLRGFARRPTLGTRGGILLLWDENVINITDVQATEFCLSAKITSIHSDASFKITTFHGPTLASRKDNFFAELLASKLATGTMWLVLGDFNQIFRARDKKNTNINRRRMNKFKATLDNCDLNPIHLQNRCFTWSNEQANPTMSRIDGAFCNPEWDLSFGHHILK